MIETHWSFTFQVVVFTLPIVGSHIAYRQVQAGPLRPQNHGDTTAELLRMKPEAPPPKPNRRDARTPQGT